MLFVPHTGRAVRQLFGNLNQYTPIDGLNRRPLPLRAESNTPALRTCCSKPWGVSFEQYANSRRNTPKRPPLGVTAPEARMNAIDLFKAVHELCGRQIIWSEPVPR
jgi:hypothetical protein